MRRLFLLLCSAANAFAQQNAASIFDNNADIGATPKHGTTELVDGKYRVTGGGANIWGAADAFQFASKKVIGDFTLTADVAFEGAGAVPHRKAVLMARQELTPDSPYADLALHGDGLTSLQYRQTGGAETQENKGTITAPERLRLERKGNVFTAYAATARNGEFQKIAGITVPLSAALYVGLGVCSHDPDVLETAVFSNVRFDGPGPRYRSHIQVYDLARRSAREVYKADEVWEAPNWSPDGKYLLANSGGRLYRVPLEGGAPEPLALEATLRCNNDHGFGPGGKQIAVSASTASSHGSQVYVANVDGTEAKRIVEPVPSYFHGWSPDGSWLSIVAQRNGNFDLFRVKPDGTGEERLTTSPGYDDGPDYSPDGKWIYFNSDRAGGWDIWRMPADGAGPNDGKAERVTSDEAEDWFPHPSPDGKWLLFLSFPHGTAGHNGKLSVELRMVPMPGQKLGKAAPKQVVTFYGGQGTINVNSWSPDSRQFAYVVYELIQ